MTETQETESDVNEISFSATAATKLANVSYRQVDYWARTGVIRPSGAPAAGSGSRRRYTRGDVLKLRIIKAAMDVGLKVATFRNNFCDLQGVENFEVVMIGSDDMVFCKAVNIIDNLTGRANCFLLLLDPLKEGIFDG